MRGITWQESEVASKLVYCLTYCLSETSVDIQRDCMMLRLRRDNCENPKCYIYAYHLRLGVWGDQVPHSVK
jgi:hypothetical protein